MISSIQLLNGEWFGFVLRMSAIGKKRRFWLNRVGLRQITRTKTTQQSNNVMKPEETSMESGKAMKIKSKM